MSGSRTHAGHDALPAGTRRARAVERSRLLVAPVPVTPTKPLTLSHLKAMLWVDTLCRATAQLRPVTCLWSGRTAALAAQTIGFWWFLDRVAPARDWATCSESEIGEMYVSYHAKVERARRRSGALRGARRLRGVGPPGE